MIINDEVLNITFQKNIFLQALIWLKSASESAQKSQTRQKLVSFVDIQKNTNNYWVILLSQNIKRICLFTSNITNSNLFQVNLHWNICIRCSIERWRYPHSNHHHHSYTLGCSQYHHNIHHQPNLDYHIHTCYQYLPH